METTTLSINHRKVPVKNLNKVFWPEEGYTKSDIMKYYAGVWPYLAPHLKDRPVSLVRYPHGITGDFFYQKNVPNPPAWVTTFPIDSEDARGLHARIIDYALINNLETMLWTVNLGCIEVHPWLSTISALDEPTYVIFDLDPMPPASFYEAVKVASLIRVLLGELKLQAFPKISGATGIHIYLPVRPGYTYQATANFVKECGELIIKTAPDLATNERQVSKRAGKVYIDHLQNIRGKTIASVYSIRPFPAAPVSLPVRWEELPDCHPAMFTIKTALPRLSQVGDLFQPLLVLQQNLPKII